MISGCITSLDAVGTRNIPSIQSLRPPAPSIVSILSHIAGISMYVYKSVLIGRVYFTASLRTMPPALLVLDSQPAQLCETELSNHHDIPRVHTFAAVVPLFQHISNTLQVWVKLRIFLLVKAISVTAKFWPMQILGPPLKGTYCQGLGVQCSQRSGLKIAGSAKVSEAGG